MIELDPSFAEAYNGRGLAKDRLGESEDALQDFSEAIARDEKNALFWHNRGCCYRTLEKYEQALKDLNQALELDKNNCISYSNRG